MIDFGIVIQKSLCTVVSALLLTSTVCLNGANWLLRISMRCLPGVRLKLFSGGLTPRLLPSTRISPQGCTNSLTVPGLRSDSSLLSLRSVCFESDFWKAAATNFFSSSRMLAALSVADLPPDFREACSTDLSTPLWGAESEEAWIAAEAEAGSAEPFSAFCSDMAASTAAERSLVEVVHDHTAPVTASAPSPAASSPAAAFGWSFEAAASRIKFASRLFDALCRDASVHPVAPPSWPAVACRENPCASPC